MRDIVTIIVFLSIHMTVFASGADGELIQSSARSQIDRPLLEAAESVWNSGEIYSSQIQPLLTETYGFSYRMPLTVVVDRNSLWSEQQVNQQVIAAKDILKKCEVDIFPVTMIKVNHQELSNFGCHNDYIFTGDLPQGIHRPLVTFVDSFKCFYGRDGGYSNPAYWTDHNFEQYSLNTAFVSYRAWTTWFPHYPGAIKNIAIHELFHILLNSGHSNIPGNILNKWSDMEVGNVASSQCNQIKNNSLVYQVR